LADCPAPAQITAYLAHRFLTGGRKLHEASGRRYMAASTLDSELAALRGQSYAAYGKLAWNPRTGDGNPFHSVDVDALVAGAKALLLKEGVKPAPAPEAYLSEVAAILKDLDAETAALPVGDPHRVIKLQLRVTFLCTFLWGDRVIDVAERDFEDVVVVATPAAAAREAARLRAGGFVDFSGGPLVAPASGGWAVVRYRLDKGAKLSRDAALVNRAQVYPLLDASSGACPALAITELAVEYQECLLRFPGLSDAQRAAGPAGPLVKAFQFANPARAGALERILPGTLDKRLNTFLDHVHGGKMRDLTGHSFRRGSSQLLKGEGALDERIMEHFRWRQAQTALGYLAPTRYDAVDPFRCTQPGGTQRVADLWASFAVLAAPLPAALQAASRAQRGPDQASSVARGGLQAVPARPAAV
jgi:hypothetical protein